ncbi:hypothetical protein [Paraburkholderia phenazinium]|nr:hypothetical protein [Paraburkholderia phenazinium]
MTGGSVRRRMQAAVSDRPASAAHERSGTLPPFALAIEQRGAS